MTYFPLPWYRVVVIEGVDALKFAQAQLMSDIGAMFDGCWQWSGWLTPKGRVIALCAVLRFDSGLLWLLLQDANADDFAERLQRFVFRSKVSISVRGDLSAFGALMQRGQSDMEGANRANAIGGAPPNRINLDLGVLGNPRLLVVAAGADGAAADPIGAQHVGTDHVVDQQRWLRVDLAHGLPHLGDGSPEQWTPQQLSLDRLRAYSVSKGCYPGQEIVARTHFLGQAKRALTLLQADIELPTGAEVTDGGRVIGTLVCSIREASNGMTTALAVLPADLAPDATLQAMGHPVTQRPLQPGLAR